MTNRDVNLKLRAGAGCPSAVWDAEYDENSPNHSAWSKEGLEINKFFINLFDKSRFTHYINNRYDY
jgi:hypothetical protein